MKHRAADVGFATLDDYSGVTRLMMMPIYLYQRYVQGLPEDAARRVHAFLLTDSLGNGVQSVTHGGVQYVPRIVDRYPHAYYAHHRYCDQYRSLCVVKSALAEVSSTGYNMWANIFHALPLLELVLRWLFNVRRRRAANNCIQYIVEALRDHGCQVMGQIAADKITPGAASTDDDMLPAQ